MNRKSVRAHISASGGIEQAMRVPKGTLTAKQKKFAEQVALGATGAQAYRQAYSPTAKPKTAGNAATVLKQHSGIALEIERIERANELAALHSATGLRSIVISTLAEIATNPEEKAATRVQAVRSIGQLVGVDAFRETKRVAETRSTQDNDARHGRCGRRRREFPAGGIVRAGTPRGGYTPKCRMGLRRACT
jgi:hypothetical protein